MQYGAVVLHAEEAEARRQEHGVAGQADKGGAHHNYAGRRCLMAEAVYAGLQPVFGKVAVDQAVSGDARQMGDEPQAQQQAGHQCRARV